MSTSADRFFKFCKMRLGLENPDDLMEQTHFTNLHREYDRSTQYYLNNCRSLDQWIVACRYNRPSTLELCVWQPDGSIDESASYENFTRHLDIGGTLNTHRYTASFWGGKSAQVQDILNVPIWSEKIQVFADTSECLSEFITKIQTLPRLGSFMSIQWGLNLSYWFYHLKIDKVPFKNGAKRGLTCVGVDVDTLLNHPTSKHLVLTNVALEMSLCEYNKYIRICDKFNGTIPHSMRRRHTATVSRPTHRVDLWQPNWVHHYGEQFEQLQQLYHA